MTTIHSAPPSIPTRPQPVRIPAKSNDRPMPRGSRRRRPGGAPPRHRCNGILMSRAPHRRQPITPAATVALALLAALITMWLGVVAHFGEVISGPHVPARVPDRLAVVRVDAGETLQHLAARVAPGAPVSQVSQRIRELNGMDSSALSAGQTLIAPIG
ncbi:MAG: LysM peptidoglycan-binding domain-containing protein [Mycobacterium sp.]|nr:LysM peptidoglycan-binding domain-containing protein [Mycobacterium sp.]